ncbi:GNAT family N-acetyltransferase [Pelagibacteraceae bacterium]|nr:GNAT family N-acetyltransferase [Pelagibacteraceae bacterium]
MIFVIKKYSYNFDFFKWIKKTELVQLAEINPEDDPVRPELDNEFRVSNGRKIFGLKYNNEIEGVVCIAFTNELPATVKELDLMSVNEKESQIAIAYTLWSLKKGAGKKIMKELLKYMKEQNNIDSIMTLSPLTPMATHYHIRNGAKLIKINPTTQNFEYKV